MNFAVWRCLIRPADGTAAQRFTTRAVVTLKAELEIAESKTELGN
jgi:hypothetical protein